MLHQLGPDAVSTQTGTSRDSGIHLFSIFLELITLVGDGHLFTKDDMQIHKFKASLFGLATESIKLLDARGNGVAKIMKNFLILAILLLASGFANAQCKVYSGASGYTVAARVENGKVYSGPSGYSVVARFENGKVYSGSSGYNVTARVEGNKIYGGSSGYNVIGRIDGDKIYLGATGYKVAARSEGCGGMSFAAAAAAFCL